MIIAFSHLTPSQRQQALDIHAMEKAKNPEMYWLPDEQIDACIVSSLTGLVKQVLYYKEFLP